MRACHFAFLGLFLSELYHEQKQRPTDLLAPFDLTVDIIKTIPNPVNPHWKPIRKIVGTKTKPNPNDNFLAIASDLGKWVDMFSGEQDPRIEIAQFCGWTTEQAKNNVNAWLNGNKRYKRLNRWLGKEFPALSMVWHSLEEKKIVGQTIADEYETPVFLDIGLYEYASDRGLKLSYEYDGVGVFGDVKDPLLEQNISAVDHYIQTQIAQRLGIENGQHLTKRK